MNLLRAVRLPAGEHRVVFAYKPASLRLGLAGFFLAGMFLLLAGWMGRRDRVFQNKAERDKQT
jgi:hypothetical protein